MRSQDWHEQRACNNKDPRLFDPLTDEERALTRRPHLVPRLIRAKRVCDSCPVLPQCKAEYDLMGSSVGVVAGEYTGVKRKTNP